MRIVIATQDAPIYLAPFLDHLLKRLRTAGHEIVGVVASSPTFRKSVVQEARARLELYGPGDFVRMTLRVAANRLGAKLAGWWPPLGCFSVGNVLDKHRVRRLKVGSVNSAELVDLLRKERIDLVVSVAAPEIFRRRLLAAPRFGCINYHTGLLPRYRGRQPLFWAMLHDEPEAGISVHEMDAGLDSGPIIVQRTVPIRVGDSLDDLYHKTVAVGPAVLAEAIERVASGCRERIVNDGSQASLFSFPDRTAGRRFRAAGKRFF